MFQCIAFLGDAGCGFEHQLASIDHALGSDNFQNDQNGNPQPTPPSTNVGFLRPEAYLGIVILTNEDDCSATPPTPLYSINVGGSNQQNIMNALGPIANYRCNQFGHLCKDPSGTLMSPPLNPPGNAMGTAAAPTLDMTDCQSNDTQNPLTTPVQNFIDDIKRLKPDPDNQILVAAITAPVAPYTVAWIPEMNGQNTQPGELWPQVLHSCGAKGDPTVNPENGASANATDGSFGDPGVRITQFVDSFPDSVLASICDPDYSQSMTAIATKLGQLITPPCIVGTIQQANGNPVCSVIEHLTDMQGTKMDRTVQSCGSTMNALPCWKLQASTAMGCTGQSLVVTDEAGISTNSESSTINCSLCLPNSTLVGCPCPSNGAILNGDPNCPTM